MDEVNTNPLRYEISHDGNSLDSQQQSTARSTTSSVLLTESFPFRHDEERVTESTFGDYRQDSIRYHSLLLENQPDVTNTSDYCILRTEDETDNDGSTHLKNKPQLVAPHMWLFEICALLVSLCAMDLLVVLLAHANGRPLNEWRFFVSFNAIISILAAIARAPVGFAIASCLGQAKWNWYKKRPDSLLAFEKFEDASRGPVGSLWLLLWLHVRHWSSFGALITIALLGFEPFLQAVVNYEGQSDKSERFTPPTLGISIRLGVGLYDEDYNGNLTRMTLPTGKNITGLPFSTLPDVRMTAALFSGLYGTYYENKSVIPTTSFSCPSGNCTWPRHTTLATCSHCNDVTSLLEQSSAFRAYDYIPLYDEIPSFGETSPGENRTTYALPYVNLTNFDTTNLSATYMIAGAVSNPGITASFQKADTLIAVVGIIRAPPSYEGVNWKRFHPRATECALYFCTKAYSARVNNGIFNESTIDVWSSRVSQSYAPAPYNINLDNQSNFEWYEEWNNHSLRNSGFGFPRYDLQLQISEQEAREKELPPHAARLFNITQSTAETASYTITNQLLPNSRVMWPAQDGEDRSIIDPFIAQTLGRMQQSDYPRFFENMAQSTTTFMRDHSNAILLGEQTEWVVHIRVQWEYLILPLLVFVGACFVLVFTIFETIYRRLEPWKSDVLATFTHSVDTEIQSRLRFAEMNGQARYTSKNTIVSLVDSGDFVGLKAKND